MLLNLPLSSPGIRYQILILWSCCKLSAWSQNYRTVTKWNDVWFLKSLSKLSIFSIFLILNVFNRFRYLMWHDNTNDNTNVYIQMLMKDVWNMMLFVLKKNSYYRIINNLCTIILVPDCEWKVNAVIFQEFSTLFYWMKTKFFKYTHSSNPTSPHFILEKISL